MKTTPTHLSQKSLTQIQDDEQFKLRIPPMPDQTSEITPTKIANLLKEMINHAQFAIEYNEQQF